MVLCERLILLSEMLSWGWHISTLIIDNLGCWIYHSHGLLARFWDNRPMPTLVFIGNHRITENTHSSSGMEYLRTFPKGPKIYHAFGFTGIYIYTYIRTYTCTHTHVRRVYSEVNLLARTKPTSYGKFDLHALTVLCLQGLPAACEWNSLLYFGTWWWISRFHR